MNKNKIQHIISCALVLGVVLVIKFLLSVTVQNVFFDLIVFFLTVLAPYLVYVFQKKYRDEELGGAISYSEALFYGFWLYFVASLILIVVQYIYFQHINPNFIANSFRFSAEKLQMQGIPENIIEEAVKIATPAVVAFMSMIIFAFWGLLIALVTSVFVKKT